MVGTVTRLRVVVAATGGPPTRYPAGGDDDQTETLPAERTSTARLVPQEPASNPIAAQDQGRHYAERLGVPFVFLSNGEEVWFLDRETDAHARKIATFYSPNDLERRNAARRNRLELSGVEIDRRICHSSVCYVRIARWPLGSAPSPWAATSFSRSTPDRSKTAL